MKSVLIVLPTLNEELVIRENCTKLLRFCDAQLGKYDWRIVVADNGSTDKTIEEVATIQHPRFSFFHTDQKGRGFALVKAWSEPGEDYVVYMDSDLSVGLESLLELLQCLDGGADIVSGSRFIEGAKVARSIKREASSRVYIFLVKWFLRYRGTDTQCGFKGLKKEVFLHLLPLINPKHLTTNSGWFFDTELLVWAQQSHYRIVEVPVEWVEKRNIKRKSKVNLFTITINYLKQILELKKRLE